MLIAKQRFQHFPDVFRTSPPPQLTKRCDFSEKGIKYRDVTLGE